MPDHIRRSARNEKPRSSGAVMIAVTASVAAVIAGVVFLSTHVNPSGPAPQQEEVAATDDSSKSDDAKATDNESKKEDEKSDSKDSEKDSKDADKDSKDSEAKDDKDAEDSQSDSARMGNSYNDNQDKDSENAEGSDSEGSSSSSSDSSSQSGSSSSSDSDSDSSSSSSSSSSSDSGSSSSSYTAPRSAAYTSADGWISAEACATEVAEVGTITASEIPFDDDIPQVGLDTSSYPYEHFGKYVEIEYNGVTVTAQVVDCGGYNAGTSGIVLNPAVFYQFGAWDVDDWGRREVSYRFV